MLGKFKSIDFSEENKRLANRNPILKYVIYWVCEKRLGGLKSGGEIRIELPSVGWGENEMANEVHGDAWYILTK